MGAIFRWIRRLYNLLINSDAIRQIVLPATASVTTTGGAANTYGAWVDVALLATVTEDTLITGISVSAPSAAGVFTVDIGSCVGYADAAAVIAAGAAAIAAAHRQEVRIEYGIVVITAVGEIGWLGGYCKLDSPISIPAGVGILARQKSVAGGQTIGVAVECKQLF
ncbi:MAG: hypothetical protein Q7J06_08040 [Bacteroidales bacterium]|nr:hypothetical protein [Bacteroidales bacterium]